MAPLQKFHGYLRGTEWTEERKDFVGQAVSFLIGGTLLT